MSGNKCFSSRRDDSYLRLLHKHLGIAHLKATAVPPREGGAWIVNGRKFARRCSISFLGIAGRNFFDRNRAFLRDGDQGAVLTSDLEEVFKCHPTFLADNVWLRVRFLFVYPYSTFAMSIINAETTTRRSSIAGELTHPTSQVELHVDEDRFKGSSLFQSQRLALKTIQQWINAYDWRSEPGHSVAVRFTTLSPNLCALLVNETAFCDSYLLAKLNRFSNRLEFSPLIQSYTTDDEARGDDSFRRVEDHYRYLWQANTTLDCYDATEVREIETYQNRTELYGLASVRPPHRISFKAKARRLTASLDSSGQPRISMERQEQWAYSVYEQFLRYVTLPQESIPARVIFISCSWVEEGFQRQPHPVARHLKALVDDDLGSSVKAELMLGTPGEGLPAKLFALLNSSSLAVFFLTFDLSAERVRSQPSDETMAARPERESLTRPNVYHELGYLMARMQPVPTPHSSDNPRVFIARDRRVRPPSNIEHLIRTTLLDEARLIDKVAAESFSYVQALQLYIELLAWLKGHTVPIVALRNAKTKLPARISIVGDGAVQRDLQASCDRLLEDFDDPPVGG